ncbi:unnamed protein product [Arctogadus glacialis]
MNNLSFVFRNNVMRYSPGYTLTIATDPKRVPVETVRIQMSGVSMETEEIDLIATTDAPAVNNVESSHRLPSSSYLPLRRSRGTGPSGCDVTDSIETRKTRAVATE